MLSEKHHAEQEKVLVDWVQYLSSTGHPLSKRTIRKKRKKAEENHLVWILNGSQHSVSHHFELLKKIIEENGIPWEDVYNMDEKGLSIIDDLRDIADALLLANDGTKSDLLTRINAHFESRPDLRTESRHIGLFNRTRSAKRPAPVVTNENEHPPEPDGPRPPTRPRLDIGDRPNSTSSPQPLSFNILNRTTGTSDQLPPSAWPSHVNRHSFSAGPVLTACII